MRIKIYDNLLKLLPAVSLLWTISCTDEVHNTSSSTDLGNEPVMVCARTVGTGVSTRSGETGPLEGENTLITKRTLLFTYPSQPTGEMKSAYCVFDENGIGYVYANMDLKGERLRWKDIRTGEKSYPGDAVDAVFLDNLVNYPVENKTWPVPGQDGKEFHINFFTRILTCSEQPSSAYNPEHKFGQDPTTAFVQEGENIYKNYRFRQMIAPVGHKETEEVDIIWGKIEKPTLNKSLQFKLEHQMSAISFRFYTDDKDLEPYLAGATEVWMDEVRIWLDDNATNTNYAQALYSSFNRKNGSVYGRSDLYREADVANGLYLVKSENTDGRPKELLEGKFGDGGIYHATPMWIVPPYKWDNKNSFPKVSLRLANGTLYTGHLPAKITYWKQDAQGNWIIVNTEKLRFWKGHHTTFKVKLISGNNKYELLFENVTVSPFESWGKIDDPPTLAESGIYSGEDFENLTKTYNANSEENNYRLMRYGRFDGGKWIFPLWRRIDIPVGQSLPQFKNDNFEIQKKSESVGIYQGGQEVTKGQLIAAPQP